MKVLHPPLNCFSHFPPVLASCTVFDQNFGIRLGAFEMCYFLVLPMYTPGLVENESYELVHLRASFLAIASSGVSLICLFGNSIPMPSWVCQWKPFWVRVGESLKKTWLEEWIFEGDDSSDEQRATDFTVPLHGPGNTDNIRDDHPPTPRPSRPPDSLPWEPTRPQDKAYFWERIEAPLPPSRPRCNFIHPRQLSPFPERLELPFSNDEILCGNVDIVSSGTAQLAA